MGNTNEKALLEQVARSPAVQNIVHETAAKLARVLSASAIELCRQILADPPKSVRQRQTGDVHVYGSVHITINNQPFDSSKYGRQMSDVMHRARRKIVDGSVADLPSEHALSRERKPRRIRQEDRWEYYEGEK